VIGHVDSFILETAASMVKLSMNGNPNFIVTVDQALTADKSD